MQKLSIIVPCFNVENFIYQCLDSIRKQTYQNIEVICIDNHSTDNTLQILKRFSKLDKRFIIIEKSTNTGYGSSLNLGLKIAKGSYIGIVEGDDFIQPNMYELLMGKAVRYNLDIARCGYWYYTDSVSKPESNEIIPKGKLIRPVDNLTPFFTSPSIWSAIYRTKFIRDNHIYFLDTPGASYQDLGFSFKTYLECDRFMMIDKCLVNYRQHATSSVRNGKGLHSIRKEWEDNVRFAQNRPYKFNKIQSILVDLINYSYRWNYQRLNRKYRYHFLYLWRKDLQKFSKDIPLYSSHHLRNKLETLIIIRFPCLYPALNFLRITFKRLKTKCQF